MSISAYADYNARTVSKPETDTIEWPAIVVLEGEAAEEEVARHLASLLERASECT